MKYKMYDVDIGSYDLWHEFDFFKAITKTFNNHRNIFAITYLRTKKLFCVPNKYVS